MDLLIALAMVLAHLLGIAGGWILATRDYRRHMRINDLVTVKRDTYRQLLKKAKETKQ